MIKQYHSHNSCHEILRYAGTAIKTGMNTWRFIEVEYNAAVLLPMIERLSKTVRNVPKFSMGRSMASSSPPTLPPEYPSSQTGTEDAAPATAAPRHWSDT